MSSSASRILVAVSVAALAAGCSSGDADAPSADDTPTETLLACVVPTPQLVEADSALGFVGFDVAVLEHVASVLGERLEFVEVTFDELVSGVVLNGMECEIGAGGVVDDDSLDAVVTPSDPYRAIDRLVVILGGPDRVEPEAVTGTVGFVEGGVAQDGTVALTNAELVPYPSLTDLERGVGTGEQGAWLVSIAEREQLVAALSLELESSVAC